MKNEREFEFRYSIDEIESVTVTSLGNWLASAQKFTRPPSAQLGRPDDPKALLLQHLTAKLVEPLATSLLAPGTAAILPARKINVLVYLAAGTTQLLMIDRPGASSASTASLSAGLSQGLVGLGVNRHMR